MKKQSKKKNDKSKNKGKDKLINKRIICIVSIAILILLLLLLIVMLKNRSLGDYYSISSRVENVNITKVENNTDFSAIGWVRVQGTKIDMPIVWSPNSEDELPVELGSFAWSLNGDNHKHNYLRVMGHNIFNLSSHPKKSSKTFERFEELMSFVYYDFAKENKYIQLTIDDKDYLYKIYSVDFINRSASTFLPYALDKDLSKKEMKDFIKLTKDNSLYDYKVDVDENDSVLALSTCTRFFGIDDGYEFYVNGRLLREDEKADDYRVQVNNKNYKEIEDILKGDGGNNDDTL